jgi:hypothetical protein
MTSGKTGGYNQHNTGMNESATTFMDTKSLWIH